MRLDLGRTRSGVPDLGGTHVVLVRHAECVGQVATLDGIEGLDSPLTELGHEQASAVAAVVATLEPDVVLTSPMIRCVATAGAIAREAARPVEVWHDLREVFPRTVVIPRTPTELSDYAACEVSCDGMDADGWTHGDDGYPGVVARGRRVVEALRDQFRDHVVVVVTHGGFGSALLAAALGVQDTWFQLDTASVTTLRWPQSPALERPDWELYPPVALEVLTINDVAHLSTADHTLRK